MVLAATRAASRSEHRLPLSILRLLAALCPLNTSRPLRRTPLRLVAVEGVAGGALPGVAAEAREALPPLIGLGVAMMLLLLDGGVVKSLCSGNP